MENTQTLIMRMKTGEDVLCRGTQNSDGGWNIKDPMALIPTPDGRLAFVGWMPFVESSNGINLPADFVLLVLKPMEDIATQYMSFKTGLATPGPKKVIAPEGFKLVGAE